MILKTFSDAGRIESKINNPPTVVIDREEAEARTGLGGGPEVVKVEAENEQGLRAVFWVSVKFNNQGRPEATISTEIGDKKVVKKKVTGTCNRL